MKFAFYTLGCKVNQYETQAMERYLTELGHTPADFGEACDVYIVNTCSVTAISDKKCRSMLRRAKKQNPAAVIAACGCYAQTAPEDLRRLGVDVIAGTQKRTEFLDLVLQTVRDRQRRELLGDAAKIRDFEILEAGGLAHRTRAMLKVEDGCDNFCTYCIIPYARGRVRSLPLSEAVRQAQTCREQGYRELVVTGIEISSWGKDLPGSPKTEELISALCRAVPELRIRLGSLEPRTVTEAFCSLLAKEKNLCPQFHLSLQSGCDGVLKRMNRHYDTERYLQSVELLKNYFPGCAVTTDIIAAFPGESEQEHKQTLAFMEKCGFAACHVFPYSRRPGTPADKLPGQHGNAVKEKRAAEIGEKARLLETRYLQNLIGTEQEVLFEQEEDGYFTGHAPNYAKVYISEKALHNMVKTCKITALFRDGVLASFEK